ncbi:pseudouridine synthase [Gongronella butleri]|nr:pseudouridine synthase [Gongronella butleri]
MLPCVTLRSLARLPGRRCFAAKATAPRPDAYLASYTNDKRVKYVDDLSTANYVFENGLRRVEPYYFDYWAHCKDRWVGKPLLDVMNREFRDRNDAYFRQAIERGLITINGERVACDTCFAKGDTMGHRVHRHEPPTSADPIRILHRDSDLLVIDKPGGIQAHPSGRYRHNTVVHILRKQYDLPSLYPVNRLDRLTSGVMMIALNAKTAQQLQATMMGGDVEKEYLCRVEGEFPSGEVVCSAPLRTIAFKFSFQYVDEVDGKASTTVFERVAFNGRTSVVRCRPVTGRTHQIRVHLRHLGFPMANDPIYGRHTPWTHELDAIDTRNTMQTSNGVINKMMDITTYDSLDIHDGHPRCKECHSLLVADPNPHQPLGIWLHSRRYTGPNWSYMAPPPPWAAADFDMDHDIQAAYL